MQKQVAPNKNSSEIRNLTIKNNGPLANLSKLQLVISVFIFSLVGVFLILHSFAATSILTVDADKDLSYSSDPGQARLYTDSSALNGRALMLLAPTTATGNVNLADNYSQISIRTKAQPCNGNPQFTLNVDGNPIYQATVANTNWIESSPMALNLASGTHSISIRMDSNAYAQSVGKSGKFKCEKALYIDTITFRGATTNTIAANIVMPQNGSVVSGGLPVEAKPSSTNSVSKVEFYLKKTNDSTPNNPYPTDTLIKVELAPPYCMAGDSTTTPGTCAAWNSASVPNGTYDLTVYAYDAAGNKSTASVVNFAINNASGGGSTTGCKVLSAPISSKLKTSGRDLVDDNGDKVCKLKGFNMHVGPGFTWDQNTFYSIRDKVRTGNPNSNLINRAVIHWDQFEPTKGVVSDSAMQALDAHVQRASAAGMYTMFELHLNLYDGSSGSNDDRIPTWTNNVQYQLDKYTTYGKTLTQALAYRYGNPNSSHYSKSVIGFGLNEPPIEDNYYRNGDPIPYLEGKQRTMIGWMRAPGYAPDWIGFVAEGYGGATTLYNTWGTSGNTTAHNASPSAYNTVTYNTGTSTINVPGSNVIYDLHDYMAGCTNTDPYCDGRQRNGMNWPTYQGGSQIGVGNNFILNDVSRGQLAAYVQPYKEFLNQASIPLMIGEWGWPNSGSGETDWITKKGEVWKDAGSIIEIYWNYDVCSCKTPWSAITSISSNGAPIWRPSIEAWLKQ